jgi:hypothetical protein
MEVIRIEQNDAHPIFQPIQEEQLAECSAEEVSS